MVGLAKPLRQSMRRMSDTVDTWLNPNHLAWTGAKTEWDYTC